MTEIQARLQSSLSPDRVLQVLTDFGPARTEAWPMVSPGTFTVHDQGEGWADVTEGNKVAWERLRYDWDATAGTVTAVTTDSNIWATGSRWEYRLTPAGEGTQVDIRLTRNGKGLKGRVIGTLLSVIGPRFVTSSLAGALKAGR